MKKSMILYLFLLIMGIAVLCYGHITLSAAQDKVSYMLVESIGDVASADGLSIEINTHYNYHLFWDTTHTFGLPPLTNTDFSFYTLEFYWTQEYTPEPIALRIGTHYAISSTIGAGLMDLDASVITSNYSILHDVASRTNNEEQHTETLYLIDYFQYYPIIADVQIGAYYYDKQGAVQQNRSRYDAGLNEALTSFFMLSVMEDDTITVSISKDYVGNVYSIDSMHGYGYTFSSFSIESKDGIFIAISMPEVFSLMEQDGVAIYFIPTASFVGYDAEDYTMLDYEHISKVYPLSDSALLHESQSVRSLALSEDSTCLNLITVDDNYCYLTVIDIETMTAIFEIILLENFEDNYYVETYYVNGLLYVALNDGRFVLLESGADNTYHHVLSGSRDHLLSFEEYHHLWRPRIAWNGERLAIVSDYRRMIMLDVGYYYSEGSSCGFVVEIYDSSGLLYKGAYESSLDVLSSQEGSFYYICRQLDGGLSVSW